MAVDMDVSGQIGHVRTVHPPIYNDTVTHGCWLQNKTK